MRRLVWLSALVTALVVSLAVWRLGEHDLGSRRSEDFTFSNGETQLSGTLWLPDTAPIAVLALVHGDGPQDRLSGGGYAPMIHAFLDAGLAVAAWDKPGVGESSGNWLDQSMQDRADETRAALAQLDARFPHQAVGALGFSQAGWVLPRLRAEDSDFVVLVGAAVNWRAQGAYYTRQRLRLEGAAPDAITAEIARQADADAQSFAPDAIYDTSTAQGLPPGRWAFIQRNLLSDSRADMAQMDMPVLAVWGAADLNVDAHRDARTVSDIFASGLHSDEQSTVLIPNATHGLLLAGPYNHQLSSQWPLTSQLRFLLEGRHAFAQDALETITNWIASQT